MDEVVICVDFGSTFTKAALVDLHEGRLVAKAEHRTTVDTDVMEGFEACSASLTAADPRAADAPVLACSSAGGGLRIAVVGNEQLVTAEAGRRVALSSGGRVVHVTAGTLDEAGVDALRAARPDVLLLTGGTDGGNSEVLLACASALAGARWTGPVVVAGNVDAQPDVAALLDGSATPYVLADNVVPRIGVLEPASARAAIREMFLRHVIGGKHLSSSPSFAAMVRGATPDLVLTAVELLASGLDADRPGVGDVVVVDVGGATTDVYSVVEPVEDESDEDEGEARGLSREVVAVSPVNRTVEGDLGMRWSAVPAVEEAYAAGLLDDVTVGEARGSAERRRDDPAFLPSTPDERAFDVLLASLAVGVALRRHAGRAQVRFESGGGATGRWVERSGVDLREVALLLGSGGALRHAAEAAEHLLDHVSGAGGWQVPEGPRVVVDVDYLLAPAGLLAERHPQAAYRLLQMLG
ncbi:MAG TPA: glutamate mutase L [Marmoricola sp.]|nr:glutamate mutase L [Marmoricola sp.]